MKGLIHILILIGMAAGSAWAGDEAPTALSNKEAISLVQDHANYLWTLIAAALVFFMQAGFAMVEAGFTRAKNAVNILMKNLMDFSMGSIVYWAIGFGLMFGASGTGWFGTSGFFLSDFTPDGDPWVLAFWMFQVVFAATAATIVSGAMAERTKFTGYLLYSICVCGLIYPIFGSWAWGSLFNGSGWLEGTGLHRFRRLHRGAFRGRLGRAGRCHCARATPGEIPGRRQCAPHPRSQHAPGGPGCFHPLAGMVRIQPRLHHDRR